MRKYKIPAALLLNGKPVSTKPRKRIPHSFDDVKIHTDMPDDSVLRAYRDGRMGNAIEHEEGSLEYSAWKSGREREEYDL